MRTVREIEQALREASKDTFDTSIIYQQDGFDYVPWDQSNRLANQVFGFLGWSSHVLSIEYVEAMQIEVTEIERDEDGRYKYGPDKRPIRRTVLRDFRGFVSRVRIEVHAWDEEHTVVVTSSHDGVGFGDVRGMGGKNPMDTACKAAKSDGISTALKHYGDYFGLFLYSKENKTSGQNNNQTRTPHTPPANNGSNQHSQQTEYNNDSPDATDTRPSPAQLKILTNPKNFGLTEAQVGKLPFKVWKGLIDKLLDKSDNRTPGQLMEAYGVNFPARDEKDGDFPWQKVS
jgi:hypothetical protein